MGGNGRGAGWISRLLMPLCVKEDKMYLREANAQAGLCSFVLFDNVLPRRQALALTREAIAEVP